MPQTTPFLSATSHSSLFHACSDDVWLPPLGGSSVCVVHQPPELRHGPAALMTAPDGMPRREDARCTGRPCSTLTRIAGGTRCRRSTNAPAAPVAPVAPVAPMAPVAPVAPA